jgi:alpha-glucoside transport system substrate-binding protein
MGLPRRRSRTRPVLGAATALAIAVGGCAATPAPAPTSTPEPDPACAAFQRYGDLAGTTVTIATVLPPASGTDAGADSGTDIGTPIGDDPRFAACTGARIEVRRVDSVGRLVAAGQLPDLGYVPGAAELEELVRSTTAVKPAPPQVAANTAEFYAETYRVAGSVDGTLYAAPLDAQVKSLVWYSPREFAARGYRIPSTSDELVALSERIAADGGTPWCAGGADGATLVDTVEDTVLRTAGPEVFDAWVRHEIPVDAPQIVTALDDLAGIVRLRVPVDGGTGDPTGVAGTPGRAGGLPIRTGGCFLHRQSDRYAQAWPAGTVIAEDGDVFAFRLPPAGPDTPPTALVGGGFVVAFSDRREVVAVQAHLSTPDWAAAVAQQPGRGWTSANTGLDPAAARSPIERLALGVLQDPRTALRYDGSDRMPAVVGSGALPQALLAWVSGTPAADALAGAEAAWPR